MKFALLVYNPVPGPDAPPEEVRRATDERVAEILARPNVTNWLIIQDPDKAMTVRSENGRTITAERPFLQGAEYVGGFIVVEADSIDEATAVAAELQETRTEGALEVRPVLATPTPSNH
jgi:hypothetical protein